MKSLVKPVVVLLLYALVFVLLVDPADMIFHLKLPLFVFILLLWFIDKGVSGTVKFRHDSVLLVSSYILIPVVAILVALIQQNFDNSAFAFGFIKSVMILVSLFVLDDYDIPIDKILIRTSIVLPVLTFLVYISFLVNPDYFNEVLFVFFSEETGSASFSLRSYYGFDLAMFFFKSSPLLVFPLGFCVYKMLHERNRIKYLLLALLFLFTMFLSGTRANMLAAVLIVIILLFEYLLSIKNKFPLFIATAFVFITIGLFIYNASFQDKEISQQIKSEHVTSYADLFMQNPTYLIWGQGLGSEFYSKGFGYYAPQSELTYIDIIRMFGIPLGAIFIIITFYPLFYLSKSLKTNKEALYPLVVFAAYLVIAGTNPLLISSTGMLALLAIFSHMRRYKPVANKVVI